MQEGRPLRAEKHTNKMTYLQEKSGNGVHGADPRQTLALSKKQVPSSQAIWLTSGQTREMLT